jgi:hypothetical protein
MMEKLGRFGTKIDRLWYASESCNGRKNNALPKMISAF